MVLWLLSIFTKTNGMLHLQAFLMVSRIIVLLERKQLFSFENNFGEFLINLIISYHTNKIQTRHLSFSLCQPIILS
jgi:hypothetical protein